MKGRMKVVLFKQGATVFTKDLAIRFDDCMDYLDGLNYRIFIKCNKAIKNHGECKVRYGWLPLPTPNKDDGFDYLLRGIQNE